MKKDNPKKQLNPYVRFTAIAFQMVTTIYLGNLLGKYIDGKYGFENELYAKICTLIAVFLAIFSVIKQVSKISKED